MCRLCFQTRVKRRKTRRERNFRELFVLNSVHLDSFSFPFLFSFCWVQVWFWAGVYIAFFFIFLSVLLQVDYLWTGLLLYSMIILRVSSLYLYSFFLISFWKKPLFLIIPSHKCFSWDWGLKYMYLLVLYHASLVLSILDGLVSSSESYVLGLPVFFPFHIFKVRFPVRCRCGLSERAGLLIGYE